MSNYISINSLTTSDYRYEVKLYIRDANNEWVDFSDKTGTTGKNALKKAGTASNKVEIGLGKFVSTIQAVTFDNSDGFFSKPFPSTLLTTAGTVAVFNVSKRKKRAVLRGLEVKISVAVRIPSNHYIDNVGGHAGGFDNIQEVPIGHFYISSIVPNIVAKTIQINLISKDGRLQAKDANGIKDGYDWYTDKSASFLIEEILKTEFSESGGSLPSTYSIDRVPFLNTIDSSRVISNLGRPPGWDGSTWHRDGFFTRALCHANVNSAGTPTYSGNRLWLGCDDQLWTLNTSTGEYTLVYDFNDSFGRTIKKIYYDSDNDNLVIILWEDEYWGGRTTGGTRTGWDFQVYYYGNDGISPIRSGSGSEYLCSLIGHMRPTKSSTPNTETRVHSFGQSTFLSSYTASYYGENLHIPFAQHISCINSDNSYAIHHAWILTELDFDIFTAMPAESTYATGDIRFEVNGDHFFYVDKGFTSGSTYDSDGVSPHRIPDDELPYACPFIFHFGKDHCMFLSNQNVSGVKYLYYINMTTDATYGTNYISSPDSLGNIFFNVVAHDVSTSTGTKVTTSLPTGFENCVPLLLETNAVGNYGYLFAQEWPNSNSVPGSMKAVIFTKNTATPTFGTVYSPMSGESGDNLYWTLTSLKFFSSNTIGTGWDVADYCVVALYNRRTGQYVLGYSTVLNLRNTTLYTSMTKLYTSNSPIVGLIIDSVDDCIYAFVIGQSKILKVTDAGVLSTLNTYPVDANESGLLSNIVVNDSHSSGKPEIYGVTSPLQNLEIYYTPQAGKYNLFRYHDSISDIINYASFDSLSKMEAITQLAQAQEQLAFFDKEGNFTTISRAFSTGTADYTIGGFESNSDVFKNIQLDMGYKSIYNVIKAKVYASTFTPPKNNSLTLLDRTDKNTERLDIEELPFVAYSVDQKDTLRKKVYAYCIKSGTTLNGTSRWKFKVFNNEIEGIIATDTTTTTDTIIYLNSVFGGDSVNTGIHTNDFATITNPDTGELLTVGITAVSTTNNTITIPTGGFGIQLKRKTIITINKGFKVDSSYSRTQWSDAGVGYLTANVALNAIAATVSVPENCPVGSIVSFGTSSYEYKVIVNDGIDITLERLDGTTTNVVQEAVSSGDIVYAYYSPGANAASSLGQNNAFQIGSSRVYVTWFTGNGTDNSDYTNAFIPGDSLVITCPGKTLEEETGSLQTIVDSTSLADYEKQEYPINNRFLHRNLSKELAKRILYYFAYPKFMLTIEVPLILYIDIVTEGHLTLIDVENAELFPNSKDYKEQFTIVSVTHNLQSLTTTLELLAIEPY